MVKRAYLQLEYEKSEVEANLREQELIYRDTLDSKRRQVDALLVSDLTISLVPQPSHFATQNLERRAYCLIDGDGL
jgi:hypothetical protein